MWNDRQIVMSLSSRERKQRVFLFFYYLYMYTENATPDQRPISFDDPAQTAVLRKSEIYTLYFFL